MSFKDISYLELWWPFCSVEQSNLCNFGSGHCGEHSCEIIFNLDRDIVLSKSLRTHDRLRPITAFGSGVRKIKTVTKRNKNII